MNDNKMLDIDGIISSSSQLNHASEQLGETCSSMYTIITALRENEDFKTMVASSTYFGSIDELNQTVPKFTEAVLKFSQFLSNYVLENYADTDAETREKIEANLAEAIAQLEASGELGATGVDYSKISTSAAGALSGDFIDSSKIRKSTFEDGELEFITRPDGSVQIVKNGTVLGYTTQDGIGNAQTQPTVSTEEVHASLSPEEIVGGVAAAGTEIVASTSIGAEETAVSGTITESVSTPVENSVAPDSASTPITGTVPSGLSSGYTGEVHTKSQASTGIKESSGNITTGNRGYTIVPDGQYTKAPGTISESDYHLLIAQVAGESGNSKDDMLGVTTTVLNRLEKEGNYGNSVREVLEGGYFPWGETHIAYEPGGKYYNTDWGQEKLRQATEVVNDALGGARNLESNVYYYSGNGEYNRFSDVL